jgi:hypothetical protein
MNFAVCLEDFLHTISSGDWGDRMILASLAAATLVATVAVGPMEPDGSVVMSAQQKNAAVQPMVRSATECIARTVLVDPHFHQQESIENLGDLIVASMPSCVTPVRAMIEAYDRYFGDGTGESFFMGPYLDALPTIVNKWLPTKASGNSTAE